MEASLVLFAYVDPAYPRAWREEPIRSHLITVSNMGATVVIVVDDTRYLMTKGRPTIKLSKDQVAQLSDGRLMKGMENGKLQMSQGWKPNEFTPERPRPLPLMREVGIEQHFRSLLPDPPPVEDETDRDIPSVNGVPPGKQGE